MAHIVLLGTCDTKLEELLYLRECIIGHEGAHVTFVDVSRTPVTHEAIDVSQVELISQYAANKQVKIADLPRGEVVKLMAQCATAYVKELYTKSEIHGIISAGGSGGTALASAVMREALPVGFPKFIVSTVASGDTGPIIGETDITMMYSVCDVAGLNSLLENILSNAAGAIVGMAKAYRDSQSRGEQATKKRIGITMFGVTTPCVDTIRKHLTSSYDAEVFVFHATGHGGRTFERLIREGRLDAVLDVTTTEICDFLTGGNMSAGPERLEAAAKAGVPTLLSLGATDMVNFGPRATVPEKYADRLLYEHNPTVTLMRTNPEECRKIGQFIVDKLLRYAVHPERAQVWIPEGGVSMMSTPGGPFADAQADRALFEAIQNGLKGSGIEVKTDKRAINDASFAVDMAERLIAMLGKGKV